MKQLHATRVTSNAQADARAVARIGMIAAVYAALTLVALLFLGSLAWGPVQFRVSEALCVLALFTADAVPGLALGCAIANLAYIFHVLPIPGFSFPLLYLSPTLVVGFLPTGLALCLAVGGRWTGEQAMPTWEPDVRALPEGRA